MIRRKGRRIIIFIVIGLIIFFIGYSYVFRTFIDPNNYLRIAWEYTDYDPHILSLDMPEVEFIWREGKPLVHMTFYTDQDRELGPYSFYIDPFQQKVVKEDPRG